MLNKILNSLIHILKDFLKYHERKLTQKLKLFVLAEF